MTKVEKEAEEFVDNKSSFWKQEKTCVESVRQAYIMGAEPREKHITELEKENAELKEKLKPENCLKLLAKEGYIKFTCENGNEHDQLTKAKELLKWALHSDPEHDEDFEQKWEEAEQFLSEVVK